MKKVYAFIFARGGSKGLPGKNIKSLGGLPLIGHSIRVGQQTPGISKVFVSTDDEGIAEVARHLGAEVILRPDELATDTAKEWGAWQHAVQYLEARGEHFDLFVSLPATSPLRSISDVEACIDLKRTGVDVVITVTPAARSPYFNMVVRDQGGISRVVCQEADYHRRQDAPDVYDMTTVAYVAEPSFIMMNTKLFAGTVASVIVPRERAIDIDDALDFRMAELLYAQKEKEDA